MTTQGNGTDDWGYLDAARQMLERCGIDPTDLSDAEVADRAGVIATAGPRFTAENSERFSAMFDDHIGSEFVTESVDDVMATMIEDPWLVMAPVLTGGVGWDDVVSYYTNAFVGFWPKDLDIIQVSRTIGESCVVEELVASFTHDLEMPAIFPGVPATGRRVELPFIVIMGFDPTSGKVAYEHVYWDQASALAQMGLIDATGLPVTGADQARRLLEGHVSA